MVMHYFVMRLLAPMDYGPASATGDTVCWVVSPCIVLKSIRVPPGVVQTLYFISSRYHIRV
jgi:hypothetical protein